MKKNTLNKYLKYLAAGIFLLALVANIRISLSDPFMFTSEMVLAQDSSSDSDEGICCDALDETCDHPNGETYHEATWIEGAATCDGHECTDCTA